MLQLLRLVPSRRSFASIVNHDLRSDVSGLLHQRPLQKVSLPSICSSITSTWKQATMIDGIMTPMAASRCYRKDYETDFAHLRQLCDHFHVSAPPPGATFFMADLGGVCSLRWERHTEVQTYTFTRSATAAEMQRPFDPAVVPVSLLPKRWLQTLPGSVISAVHAAVLAEPASCDFDQTAEHFHRSSSITACSVGDGQFHVYSDWRLHSDSFVRFVIQLTPGTAPNRTAAGKVLQRMIEVEKYRVLALMGLPYAQQLTPRVDALHHELQEVMDSIGATTDLHAQRELLEKLRNLIAASLKLSSFSHFRFSASTAYSKVVDDRLDFLQMGRVEGLQSMADFICCAMHPAIRTCDLVASRLEKLESSSQLTADLLRTSLTVEQQSQNIQQLEQIQETSRTQLLLQECVEGLSVVAITYYSIGVLGYICKLLDKLGVLPAPHEVVLGCSVPVVGLCVWMMLKKLKHSVLKGNN